MSSCKLEQPQMMAQSSIYKFKMALYKLSVQLWLKKKNASPFNNDNLIQFLSKMKYQIN